MLKARVQHTWFMRDVLPTPLSPSIMTFSKIFFRDAIFARRGDLHTLQNSRIRRRSLRQISAHFPHPSPERPKQRTCLSLNPHAITLSP